MSRFASLVGGVITLTFVAAAAVLHAQTPAPASTPEPGASPPAANLEAPAELQVFAESVRWRDSSTGEQGYRVVATLGGETRTFDLPADAAALTMPDDFRASCGAPGRSILRVRVFAFSGTQEGPASSGESATLCPPAAATATATPGPPALPSTGAGGASGSTPWGIVVLAVVGFSAVALGLAAVRTTRRR